MSTKDIKKYIEVYFNVEDISIKSRQANLVMYRYLFYKLSKECTGDTLQQIGKAVNRDYTTVIAGLRVFPNLLRYYPEVECVYNFFIEKKKNRPEEIFNSLFKKN